MGHEMPSYLNANVLIIIVNIQDEAGSVSVSQLNQYGCAGYFLSHLQTQDPDVVLVYTV